MRMQARGFLLQQIYSDRLFAARICWLKSGHHGVVRSFGVGLGRGVSVAVGSAVPVGVAVAVELRRWRIGLRAVSPACVHNAKVTSSAPDDHFAAGPYADG